MNNTTENVIVSEDNIAMINISVNIAELEPYKKMYIKEKKKITTLKGFRKGAAPEAMISQYFNSEAEEAAKNNIIYNKYTKLLQEHKLQALSNPTIEKIDKDQDLIKARISVEVLQPVMLEQYLGLELQKMPKASPDDNVKKTLHELKQIYPKLIDIDAPAQNGYIIKTDFTITIDGQQSEKQNDFNISLGLNLYFDAFENNLIGMRVGEEKNFTITFSDNYPKEEYRNKEASFYVLVKSVQDVKEYTDEELATLLGYETLEKMTESILKEAEAKYLTEEKYFYENQILEQLLNKHKINIPKKLINDETKRIIQEQSEIKPQQAEEMANRFVKTDLILHAIYERHPEIQFTQETFNAKIKELAEKSNDTIENVIKKLKESNKLQMYINYLKNCQVIDFIIKMSEIKEKENG